MAQKPKIQDVETFKSEIENNTPWYVLSEKYGVAYTTIWRLSKKYCGRPPEKRHRDIIQGEDIKKLKLLVEQCFSSREISEKTGWNTSVILRTCRRHGINKPIVKLPPHKSKYSFDHDYFQTIDTEKKAYFVGFISADGCIQNSWSMILRLNPKDMEILDVLAKDAKCNYRPRLTENNTRATLGLYDRKLVSDLAKYGVVPRKTKTLEFAKNIPEKFMYAYLRGVFDGDGCVAKNGKRLSLVTGSKTFLDGLCSWYEKRFGKKPYTSCEGGTKWRAIFGAQHKEFADFIYKDAMVGLSRKIQRYKDNWCKVKI